MNYKLQISKYKKFILISFSFFGMVSLILFSLLYLGKYTMFEKGLQIFGIHAFLEAKEIGKGYALLKSSKDSKPYVTKFKKNISFLSSFCGKFKEGEIVQNNILYKNKIYTIYTDIGEVGEDDLGYTNADVLDLSTGKIQQNKEISSIPPDFKNLTYNQVYGEGVLPKRLIRLDATYYSKLDEPVFVVSYGDSCETILVSILGIDLLLGISVLLLFLLN
jgi:hypothetical protein